MPSLPEDIWSVLSTVSTVVSVIVAAIALVLIYIQIKNAKNVAAYDFLLRRDQTFISEEMKKKRQKLADLLVEIVDKHPKKIREYCDVDESYCRRMDDCADAVSDYFETLGLMLRKQITPKYFIWTMRAYHTLRYWTLLESYVVWRRKRKNDQTFYIEFEFLYKEMLQFEKKMRKRRTLNIGPKELREFLKEEQEARS